MFKIYVNLHKELFIMNRENGHKPVIAHLSMFGACAFWGLMAPLGKDAMVNGLDGITMVSLRVFGGATLFWLTSLFIKSEKVPTTDVLMLAGAALFGLVCNQCCYTIGLSLTSPINASIVTTSMPIFAMVLSFLILKEPITIMKTSGVVLGFSGALILILTSSTHTNDRIGDIRGDLLCLGAQLSFALYLSLFNKLIRRYNVFTINKWMFLFASVMILPFTFSHVVSVVSKPIPASTWLEACYVVFFGTYISYILTMIGQRTLRPTVVSVYNYVQPIVAVVVSILTGIGVMKLSHGIAVLLVFTGVWLVTKSRKRGEIPKRKTSFRASIAFGFITLLLTTSCKNEPPKTPEVKMGIENIHDSTDCFINEHSDLLDNYEADNVYESKKSNDLESKSTKPHISGTSSNERTPKTIEDEGIGILDDETGEHYSYGGDDDEDNVYDYEKYAEDEGDF